MSTSVIDALDPPASGLFGGALSIHIDEERTKPSFKHRVHTSVASGAAGAKEQEVGRRWEE